VSLALARRLSQRKIEESAGRVDASSATRATIKLVYLALQYESSAFSPASALMTLPLKLE
jgi:hypothetical protein